MHQVNNFYTYSISLAKKFLVLQRIIRIRDPVCFAWRPTWKVQWAFPVRARLHAWHMPAWCGLLLFSCIRSSTTDLQMCVNVYIRPAAGAGNARLDTWSSIIKIRLMLKGLHKHGCPELSASETLLWKSSLTWVHQELMWMHSLCS